MMKVLGSFSSHPKLLASVMLGQVESLMKSSSLILLKPSRGRLFCFYAEIFREALLKKN